MMDPMHRPQYRSFRLVAAIVAVVSLQTWAGAGKCVSQDLTTAFGAFDLQKVSEVCSQPDDALWRSIPWNISLIKGQNLAAERKQPIFIWAMDGHPLGCT